MCFIIKEAAVCSLCKANIKVSDAKAITEFGDMIFLFTGALRTKQTRLAAR